MKKIKIIVFVLSLMLIPTFIYANGTEDYLILQDIGSYKFITQSKNPLTKKIIQIPGYRMWNHPGVVAGAGHFALDHVDTTYETDYESDADDLGVEVQVTQHAGSDSDKWLLHEVERGFRSDELEKTFEGTIKEIDGNKIFTWLLGTEYRWISNNMVVQIEYSDQELTKPKPLEIVNAYLAKHPSTITLTDSEAKSASHNEKWIKDEMDRRLWLGDKWIVRIETVGNLNELSSVVKSLNVFLDYREKYYGINAENEKKTIGEYLQAKNKSGIKNKLEEYKTWWAANKDKPINL